MTMDALILGYCIPMLAFLAILFVVDAKFPPKSRRKIKAV